jgi:hypothetical protein
VREGALRVLARLFPQEEEEEEEEEEGTNSEEKSAGGKGKARKSVKGRKHVLEQDTEEGEGASVLVGCRRAALHALARALLKRRSLLAMDPNNCIQALRAALEDSTDSSG